MRKSDSGYSFSEILLRPTLMISSEQDQGRALGLLHKAKALCMVSRALATAPKLEVRVQVSKLLPVG